MDLKKPSVSLDTNLGNAGKVQGPVKMFDLSGIEEMNQRILRENAIAHGVKRAMAVGVRDKDTGEIIDPLSAEKSFWNKLTNETEENAFQKTLISKLEGETKLDLNQKLGQLELDYMYEPDKFQEAAQGIVTKTVSNTNPMLAQEMFIYGTTLLNNTTLDMRTSLKKKQMKETIEGIQISKKQQSSSFWDSMEQDDSPDKKHLLWESAIRTIQGDFSIGKVEKNHEMAYLDFMGDVYQTAGVMKRLILSGDLTEAEARKYISKKRIPKLITTEDEVDADTKLLKTMNDAFEQVKDKKKTDTNKWYEINEEDLLNNSLTDASFYNTDSFLQAKDKFKILKAQKKDLQADKKYTIEQANKRRSGDVYDKSIEKDLDKHDIQLNSMLKNELQILRNPMNYDLGEIERLGLLGKMGEPGGINPEHVSDLVARRKGIDTVLEKHFRSPSRGIFIDKIKEYTKENFWTGVVSQGNIYGEDVKNSQVEMQIIMQYDEDAKNFYLDPKNKGLQFPTDTYLNMLTKEAAEVAYKNTTTTIGNLAISVQKMLGLAPETPQQNVLLGDRPEVAVGGRIKKIDPNTNSEFFVDSKGTQYLVPGKQYKLYNKETGQMELIEYIGNGQTRKVK